MDGIGALTGIMPVILCSLLLYGYESDYHYHRYKPISLEDKSNA